jgi:hypothetical protein
MGMAVGRNYSVSHTRRRTDESLVFKRMDPWATEQFAAADSSCAGVIRMNDGDKSYTPVIFH